MHIRNGLPSPVGCLRYSSPVLLFLMLFNAPVWASKKTDKNLLPKPIHPLTLQLLFVLFCLLILIYTKVGYAHNPNSKSEFRNSKQTRMTKTSMKTQKTMLVSNFEHLNFDIVSDFVLRISDFLTTANGFLVFHHGFSWLRYYPCLPNLI